MIQSKNRMDERTDRQTDRLKLYGLVPLPKVGNPGFILRLLAPRDGNIRSPLYWNQPKQRCEHPTDRSYPLRAKAKDIDAAELQ